MGRCFVTQLLRVCILTALMATQAPGKDDVFEQKRELQEIQTDLDRGKKALDSLKLEELDVQGRISEYDQKITSNRKIVTRLTRQLSAIREEVSKAEQRLSLNEQTLERNRRRYLGNVRQSYLAARRWTDILPDRPNKELELNRQIVYLTALAGYESGNVAEASAYLTESVKHLENLTGEKRKVASLKKKRETASTLDRSRKEKQQKELARLHREKTAEADRVLMLEQAVQEMEAIIERLERERRRRVNQRRSPAGPSVFGTLQGQLVPPYKGKIVKPFGPSIDPITNLRSFSPGITIEGKAGREVVAVASGIVAYIGELRGYGSFVIIEHGDQYYSTHAGLGKTFVDEGRHVQAGTKLAVSDKDGMVRYELRQGRKPLDPVKWIKIDSY